MSVRTTACAALLLAGPAAGASGQGFERLADGVAVTVGGRRLEVRACREDIVRVLFAPPGAFFARRSLATVPAPARRRLSR